MGQVLRNIAKCAMIAAVASPLMIPVSALAQSAPVSRPLTLTYTGTVQSSVGDTIQIRQPDGTIAPWTGSIPANYPYKAGDPVTISFTATVPTKAFYDTVYTGAKPADGIYKISVASPYYATPGPGGVGSSSAATVSGGIGPVNNFGQPTNTRMTLYYDYNSDTYSISQDFSSGAYGGANVGLIYNAVTGQLETCNTQTSCRASPSSDPVIFSLKQLPDGTITTGNILVTSTDPTSSTGTGIFDLIFNGSWNLPVYNPGGVATPVPEPGMLTLFGAAALVPAWRRRRAHKMAVRRAA